MARAVELMFTLMFDCTREKEHLALIDLLVQLCKRNGCTKDDLIAGMKTQVWRCMATAFAVDTLCFFQNASLADGGSGSFFLFLT